MDSMNDSVWLGNMCNCLKVAVPLLSIVKSGILNLKEMFRSLMIILDGTFFIHKE